MSGIHKVPQFCPSHSVVHKSLITALWKQRQGNHKYKVTLDYIGSSRPAWGTETPNSKEKRESTAQGHYLLLSCKGKTSKVLIAKAMKQTQNRSCQVTGPKDISARPFRALWIHFPSIAKTQSCKPKPRTVDFGHTFRRLPYCTDTNGLWRFPRALVNGHTHSSVSPLRNPH